MLDVIYTDVLEYEISREPWFSEVWNMFEE